MLPGIVLLANLLAETTYGQDPSQQGFGVTKGYPVDFTVRGADWDTLVASAVKLRGEIEASGFVKKLYGDQGK